MVRGRPVSIEARATLMGLPASTLKVLALWLSRHVYEREQNLDYARAHAAAVLEGRPVIGAEFARANAHGDDELAAVDSMVTHYTGEASAMHCLMSDIEAELLRIAMLEKKRGWDGVTAAD